MFSRGFSQFGWIAAYDIVGESPLAAARLLGRASIREKPLAQARFFV
jgi:hypothetical protein